MEKQPIYKAFTVNDLPRSERPRERLQKLGVEALSIQELIALVIGSGNKNSPVLSICNELLKRFGSLKGIAKASSEDLKKVGGIKKARSSKLMAVFEIARRLEAGDAAYSEQPVATPEDAWNVVKDELKGKKR